MSYKMREQCLWIFFLYLACGGVLVMTQTDNSTIQVDVILLNSSGNNSKELYSNVNACQVEPLDTLFRDTLSTLLTEGAKMIEFDLEFEDHNGSLSGENNGTIFKPLRWIRTTGRHGRGLLLLRYDFEILSLSALSYGVERIDVKLKQTPSKCLTNRNVDDIEKYLINLLLNDFQSPAGTTGSLSSNEHICNMHVESRNGEAIFYHKCCHRDPDGNTVCSRLQQDTWISILFISIVIIKVFVIMYTPLLVPQSWYRLKYGFASYKYILKKPLTLSVLKRNFPHGSKKGPNVVSASKFNQMPKFKQTMEKLKPEVPYSLKISKTCVQVKLDRLVPENDAPVGIVKTIYDQIFRCKIHEKKSLKGCCEGSIFGPNNPFERTYPWYKCLREIMRAVILVIVSLPWIIRVYIYFTYEDSEMVARKSAADERSLTVQFPGSITLYLTPVHIIFLLCYFILLIDGIFVGVLRKTVKEKFKYVMRKCFRDMREMSRSRACGWVSKILLLPFEHCGIMGFIVIAFYWIPALPVVICVLAFYWFPTLNLTVRLIAHFCAYLVPYDKNSPCFAPLFECGRWIYKMFSLDILAEKENLLRPQKITMQFRFLQLFVIMICLVSMYSVVFLAMECISFFVEVCVYTLIGIILNASQTLKYLSLLFMLVIYGKDCFNSVGDVYLSFNKKIHAYVLNKTLEDVKEVTRLCEKVQENTAFRIEPEGCSAEKGNGIIEAKWKTKEREPKWEISCMVLMMDKKDTPYITRRFFFDTCYMQHSGCPGSLYVNLLKALTSFMCIVIFLLFVLFVVMAFSEDYSLSGTNQMLATLAGGLLPWLFRNILLKKPETVTVDTDNLNFQNCFNDVLKKLKQSWPVSDIEVDEFNEINKDGTIKLSKEARRYNYRTQSVTGSQIYSSTDALEILEIQPMLPEEPNNANGEFDVNKVDLIINTTKVDEAIFDV